MNGKHVFISGAAGALGGSVRAAFERAGATLHAPAFDALDLTDEAAVVKYFAALPPLWASVHLAGGFAMGPFIETSLEGVRKQLDLNFVTAFLCCREAVKQGATRIVNVASRAALEPAGGTIAYAAAKAALVMMTRALAEELKAKGVLVNAVAPSLMDTPANRRAMPDADHARWPKTDEVARSILWLASPENTLTSGAVVPVYGAV